MTDIQLRIRVAQSLTEVEAAAWNFCAAQPRMSAARVEDKTQFTSEDNSSPELSSDGQPPNPFVSYEFLSSLEESGAVGGRTGWQPRHLLLEEAGKLLGAVPSYVKGHSRGEYIFDHGWAEAYERAGGNYYPKLLAAVPFTPVPGPRLLVRPGPEAEIHRRHLAEGLAAAARQLGVSSVHVNFPEHADAAALTAAGMMQRVGTQYHWHNQGYDSFEAFLGALASRKRKMIRKEREAARREGLRLH